MTTRVLLFLSLCSIAIHSMTIGDPVELRIAQLYVTDWFYVGVFYRAIIFCVVYIAFCVILGAKNTYTSLLLLIVTTFIIVDSGLYLYGFREFEGLFIHPFYQTTSYLSLVVLIISSLLYIIYLNNKTVKSWVYWIAIGSAIGLSLIRVVYRDDWMNVSSNGKEITIEQINRLVQPEGVIYKKALVPFLSTSCAACRLSALKMGISHRNNTLPPTHILFKEPKEKVLKFLKETQLSHIKYTVLPADTFLYYSGFKLPSVFFVENNNSTHWVGEQFNNIILSTLADHN